MCVIYLWLYRCIVERAAVVQPFAQLSFFMLWNVKCLHWYDPCFQSRRSEPAWEEVSFLSARRVKRNIRQRGCASPTIKSLDLSFSRCNSMSGFSTYYTSLPLHVVRCVCVCAWRAILMPLYLQRVLISVHSFLLTSLFSISRCLWNLFLSPQNFLQGNITLHNENGPFHTPHSGVFTQNNFNNPAGRAYDSITFLKS